MRALRSGWAAGRASDATVSGHERVSRRGEARRGEWDFTR
jgi:hypothetical protein